MIRPSPCVRPGSVATMITAAITTLIQPDQAGACALRPARVWHQRKNVAVLPYSA